MNNETIKRSEAIEAIKSLHNILGDAGTKAAVMVLEGIPALDAVAVVHAKWVNPYINFYGHPCHCCSACGFKASYQDKNYCPNCGAIMDLEEQP